MEKKKLKVNVLPSTQQGKQIVVGALRASDLELLWNLGILGIDIYRPGVNEDGYQRDTQERRWKAFARFLGKKNACPTSLTFYIRKIGDGLQLNNGVLEIELSERTKPAIYVADGMHRVRGWVYALSEGLVDRTVANNIPFTVTISNSEDPTLEEAEQFYHINNDAKRVRTDLTRNFILRRMEAHDGVIKGDAPLPKSVAGDEKIAYATAIVKMLAQNPKSVWFERIALGNEQRNDRPSLTEFCRSMTTSYIGSVSLMDRVCLRGMTPDEVVELISDYWSVIFELCPEASAPETAPDYVLTKTAGVHSLNGILAAFVNTFGDLPTKDELKTVLQKAENEFCDAYWASDSDEGAARFGTGGKSFKDLAEELYEAITP